MPRAPFPSGRKSLLLLAFAAVVSGVAWWWQRPPPEPEYLGWPLSQWLVSPDVAGYSRQLRQLTPDNGGPVSQGGAAAVILKEHPDAFGDATIPWLIYTIEHGRHPTITQGPLPFDHAPAWLRRMLPERWGGFRASSLAGVDERALAADVICQFGPKAAPAIPALTNLLERESEIGETDGAVAAARALNAIGPAAWPVVQQSLEHGNPLARQSLLATISARLGSVGQPASEAEVAKVVAILLNACRDPDVHVRQGAAHGIGACYQARPDLSALDPAMFALSRIDTTEKRSDARLRTMLLDPDPDCRLTAAWVLETLGLSKSADGEAPPTQWERPVSATLRSCVHGCRAVKALRYAPHSLPQRSQVAPPARSRRDHHRRCVVVARAAAGAGA